MKKNISFKDYNKIDIRIGTIIEIKDFEKADKPAYQIKIDFGELGIKKTSAQITKLYSKTDLLNRQVLAVINFKPKQIANFMSECLILGIQNADKVTLLQTKYKVKNGSIVG
jgi:tRNA-binding protein